MKQIKAFVHRNRVSDLVHALEAAGFHAELADVTMRPENPLAFSDEDAAKMQRLIDALEDLDDVQEVYHNAEL